MKILLGLTFAKGFTALVFVGGIVVVGGAIVYLIGKKKNWF